MTDETVQPQLGRLLEVVEGTLGAVVVGSYLHGSAVTGGLKPRSDLDVLVVTSRATSADEKRRLVDGLLPISNRDDLPGYERPLELTIVVASDLRPWRYPPHLDFQYGDWLRERFARGELEPEKPANSDLAIMLAAVLGASLTLAGPPPAHLVDPIPTADLRRAMTDELPSLLADLDTDTRNIILTLARIWTTLATGEIRSKDAAADFVLTRLPREHRAVLARARAIYLDEEPERWDDLHEEVHAFAEHVLRSIRAAPPS
jgi:streptomycin 3"-adenylyltransferase